MFSDNVSVLSLVLLFLLTGKADGDQNLKNPAPDFSRHSVVKPVVLHARSKREISTTRDTNDAHHQEVTISVPIDGEEDYIIDLSLNHDLITDNHILSYQDDGRNVLYKPKREELDFCHYGGSIRNKPGSWVAVSTCHGIQGIMFDGERMRYIEPAQDGGLTSQHYVYDHSDVIDPYLRGFVSNETSSSSRSHKIKRRISRLKRSAVSDIHEPFNANKESRYVELVLVADSGVYRAHYRDKYQIHHQMLILANYINALFSPLNIFVALVGVEVWENDPIAVLTDSSVTLKNFAKYKTSTLKNNIPHDNAQLLVQRKFDGTTVGLGYVGSMCTSDSCAIVNNHTKDIGLLAMTMAHEMGHNFGMHHDMKDMNCECKEKWCIMNEYSVKTTHWSSCSLATFDLKSEKNNYCLRNKPERLFASTCGNGFVEPGEQCDCGTMAVPGAYNPCHACCDPNTCMLRANATCGAGMCCDLQTCRPKSRGTTCRAAQDCDLPEYCDGSSEYCPDDVYVMDGTSCKAPGMVCNNKECKQSFKKKTHLGCSSGCSGRGVCNSKGNCHCEAGYSPPFCSLPGPGGSYDSGPATDTTSMDRPNNRNNKIPQNPNNNLSNDRNNNIHNNRNENKPDNWNTNIPNNRNNNMPINPFNNIPKKPYNNIPKNPTHNIPINPKNNLPKNPTNNIPKIPDSNRPNNRNNNVPKNPNNNVPNRRNNNTPNNRNNNIPVNWNNNNNPKNPTNNIPNNRNNNIPNWDKYNLDNWNTNKPNNWNNNIPNNPTNNIPGNRNNKIPNNRNNNIPNNRNNNTPNNRNNNFPNNWNNNNNNPKKPTNNIPSNRNNNKPNDRKNNKPDDRNNYIPRNWNNNIPDNRNYNVPNNRNNNIPNNRNTNIPNKPNDNVPNNPNIIVPNNWNNGHRNKYLHGDKNNNESTRRSTNFMIAMYAIFLGVIPALLIAVLLFISRQNILQRYKNLYQRRLSVKSTLPVNTPRDAPTYSNTGGACDSPIYANFENIKNHQSPSKAVGPPIHNKRKCAPQKPDSNIDNHKINLTYNNDLKVTQALVSTNVHMMSNQKPNATDLTNQQDFNKLLLQTKPISNVTSDENDFKKAISLVKLKPIANSSSNDKVAHKPITPIRPESKTNNSNEKPNITKLRNENERNKLKLQINPNQARNISKEKSIENVPTVKPSIKHKPNVNNLSKEKPSNLSNENEQVKPQIKFKPNVKNLSTQKSNSGNSSNDNNHKAKPLMKPKPNVKKLSNENEPKPGTVKGLVSTINEMMTSSQSDHSNIRHNVPPKYGQ